MTRLKYGSFAVLFGLGLTSWAAFSPAQADSCPADISNLAPGTWCEVPNSHMRDVAYPWPAGVTYTVNGVGVEGVIDLWNSGAYDTIRDRLVVWGGGHNGYGGNEIYAFDVNQLKWQRIIDPSLQLQPNGSAYYSDGTPAAQHTYGGMQYLQSVDRLLIFPGNGYWGSVSGGSEVNAFDFNAKQWERKADANGFSYSTSAYDPVTGHAWVQSNAGSCYISEYDPVNNTWTQRSSSLGCYDYYTTMAIDPVRRRLVVVGSGNLSIWDISQSGNIQQVSQSTVGGSAIINAQSPGFVYDPSADKFVAWNGGTDVYTLNMDTFIWTPVTLAATNNTIPTAANSAGTYGRFRYIPSKNAYIVVNSVDQDVYFYKMASSAAGSQKIPQAPSKPTLQILLQ